MKRRDAPKLEPRRTQAFAAELSVRARAWIPSWALDDGEGDFGRALLQVAARYDAEVAERLDGAGEKLRDGLFDWLGAHGEAARPARVPVAFKLGDKVSDPVLASAPVRLTADVDGASVVFETETDVQLVPAKLESLVCVEDDKIYFPPPGLASLEPQTPVPTQWLLKSFAAPGAKRLQLDPAEGLVKDIVLACNGQRFRIVSPDKGLVTIAAPLSDGLPQGAVVHKVEDFPAYDGKWIDEQAHILYLGSAELFDIEAVATLDIFGAQGLTDVAWAYWGKRKDSTTPDIIGWQPLKVAKDQRPDALVLEKEKGSVELREIDGKPSRWIRGVASQVRGVKLAVESLGVRVNYELQGKLCQALAGTPSVTAEAMANTTPLVLSLPFYPLGREPRQFDAFYLGSAEAFSKPGAEVKLCFEMADLSFKAFACLRTGQNANAVLAGITRDGGLQLLSFKGGALARFNERAPLHPPSPGALGAVVNGPPVELLPGPMAMWGRGDITLVAATSDNNAVWVWREVHSEPRKSGWKGLPDLPSVQLAPGQQPPPIDGLVYVQAPPVLLALRGGELFAYDPEGNSATWTKIQAKAGLANVTLARISPIFLAGATTHDERVVGVATNGKVYAITIGIPTRSADCLLLMTGADRTVAPAAILRTDDKLVAVACAASGSKFLGFLSGKPPAKAEFGGLLRIEPFGIDAAVANGCGVFVATLVDDHDVTRLVRWSPYEATVPNLLVTTPIPHNLGPAGGVPVVLPTHVVVPALSSQVLVATFDPKRCVEREAPLRTAIITTPAPDDPLQVGDQVAFPVGPGFEINDAPSEKLQDGTRLLAYDVRATGDNVIVYPPANAGTLSPFDSTKPDIVKLTTGPVIPHQTRLLIKTDNSTQVYLVVGLAGDEATLERNLDHPLASPNGVKYWLPVPPPTPNNRRVVPLLETDPTTNSGDWKAELLDRVPITFRGAIPTWQGGDAVEVDGNGHPKLVKLKSAWTTPPPVDPNSIAKFVTDAALEPWFGQLADTTSNPKLSWEYWNGTGWWTLGATDIDTLHLKRSGAVTFKVPADLRATDWSGKTSHWIRARLVGGDYGHEKVTVYTSPTDDPKVTKQTFDRDPSTIRAPYVASLRVSYALPTPVLPKYVLAQDSGTTRDQSDANRTPAAIVEAFVPLPVALGRLSTPATRTDDDAEACPPPCTCGSASTATSSSTMPTSNAPGQIVLSRGRTLFLGFRGALAGQPVRLFMRVLEGAMQDARTQVRVEALVADRFVKLVSEDATRALSESGMLTLTFDDAPTPCELFGKALRWLRVTPPDTMSRTWAPVLQGAYINASWATAAETLTYERLGSSIGAPTLVLSLARPPILRNTLELRVREPLGDEERKELLKDDQKRVVSNLADLPGDWVRWDQVFDPGDEDASRRAYALDEATGEIVFGDGEHGMIPPIGQDNIVAFRYQRTERAAGDSERVPANAVALRTTLNLASPVAGVEAVFAADQAAGGAPPEAPARILRFGGARLRHRNRAITLADLEDIALQTSPAIAQARCFPAPGGVRLVVAMRGEDPQPNAAQRRELLRALLPVAPVGLAAPRALRIEGPTERALDVALRLQVDSLDDAGAVAQSVRTRLATWFDPVTGGARAEGWPMGRSPDASDIALALVDTPRLRGIPSIELHEAQDAGRRGAWPATIGASDLIVLQDDAVHFEFATSETSA